MPHDEAADDLSRQITAHFVDCRVRQLMLRCGAQTDSWDAFKDGPQGRHAVVALTRLLRVGAFFLYARKLPQFANSSRS